MNTPKRIAMLLILLTTMPSLHCWEWKDLSLKSITGMVNKIAWGFPFCYIGNTSSRDPVRKGKQMRIPWSPWPIDFLTCYSRRYSINNVSPTDIKYEAGQWHYKNIARLAVFAGVVGGSIYALKNWDTVSSQLHSLSPFSNS